MRASIPALGLVVVVSACGPSSGGDGPDGSAGPPLLEDASVAPISDGVSPEAADSSSSAGDVTRPPSETPASETPAGAGPATPTSASASSAVRPGALETELTQGDTIPGHPSWTEQDYAILERTVRWAFEHGVDTLPMGERVARIGRQYVGTAYVPRTLDPAGPERLVINLRALDCVTYVEAMLTLARLVRSVSPEILDRPGDLMDGYEAILASLRYRKGEIRGYPSRLHYFSEWIAHADAHGLVENVTDDLGGVADPEALDFMTTHRDAYDQLADDAVFRAVLEVEERLGAETRLYVPEERVAEVQEGIRTGDIIAATSVIEGLDVAHTGIAVWDDGVLRLMHAPLVGEAVQVSEEPLARRLLRLERQDGIMVARPLEVE